jgi:hypothetical protein
LTKYTVKVHRKYVIDYEKLRTDDPKLYKVIVAGELNDCHEKKEEI